MEKFKIKIVALDRLFFEGEAEKIIAATTAGDIGILKNHADLISNLDFGVLRIFIDGQEKRAAISKGLITVTKERTSIIAARCEWTEEIDLERAHREKAEAEESIKSARTQREMDIAEFKLKKAINRINCK